MLNLYLITFRMFILRLIYCTVNYISRTRLDDFSQDTSYVTRNNTFKISLVCFNADYNTFTIESIS